MTDTGTGTDSEFQYFDGRERCSEVRESELNSVDIERSEVEMMVHGSAIARREVVTHFDPPDRLLYPRPVESIAEARALYLTDEITLAEFENYLGGLLADADPEF